MSKRKDTWGKIWHFIWEDDSIWSWLVNIILAFILIKFIVYPGLGLLFATKFPVVAVVSGSMDHNGNFDNWWEQSAICNKTLVCKQGEFYNNLNISKDEFEKYRFKNGFNKGDIMILIGKKPKDIKIGDVIVFTTTARPDPIIHRVVNIWQEDGKYYYQTKGDANQDFHPGIAEVKIVEDRLLGKAVVRVPFLGWVKIGFVNIVNAGIGVFKSG